MRRHPLPCSIALAVALLAVTAPLASAQTDSPAPTPPPRQFATAQLAALANELDDPALNKAVLDATARATKAIGAKKAKTGIMPAENVLQAARDWGDQELDVVVVSGIGAAETIDLARTYPNTVYVGVGQGVPCVTQDAVADPSGTCEGDAATLLRNYISTIYRDDQAGYLAGIVAALASRSGRIGAIGGWPDCELCNRYIQGFELGARSIDPDIKVEIAYLTDDDPEVADPDLETARAFAEAFIDVYELDVLLAASGGGSPGLIGAACDAGIVAIGTEVDRALENPKLARCIVTSATRDLARSIEEAIYSVSRAFQEGSVYRGGGRVWDVTNGGVGLAPAYELESSLPVEVPNRLEEALAAIRAGQVQTCPERCGLAQPPGAEEAAAAETEG